MNMRRHKKSWNIRKEETKSLNKNIKMTFNKWELTELLRFITSWKSLKRMKTKKRTRNNSAISSTTTFFYFTWKIIMLMSWLMIWNLDNNKSISTTRNNSNCWLTQLEKLKIPKKNLKNCSHHQFLQKVRRRLTKNCTRYT